MKPIRRPLPMLRNALRQNTGKQVRRTMPKLQARAHLVFVQLALLEVVFHEPLVVLCGFLHQRLVQGFRAFALAFRYGLLFRLAALVLEHVHGHAQQVDDAVEAFALFQRVLHQGDGAAEMLLRLRHRAFEVGSSDGPTGSRAITTGRPASAMGPHTRSVPGSTPWCAN
jgi:hypothetical protein